MKKTFLLDMDGVIVNFVKGIIKVHNLNIKEEDWTSWDHHKVLGIPDSKLWELTNDGKFWEELEEYSWSRKLYDLLISNGDVIFCTSPSLDHTCASQKIKWLRDHGYMSPFKNDYMIGPHKELLAKSGAILIDDSDSNVKKFRENGGTAVLFPQYWNNNAWFAGPIDATPHERLEFVRESLKL